MPVITAQMSEEEKETMNRMIVAARRGEVHPTEVREEMISFIEDLLHKAFSEGTIHNS